MKVLFITPWYPNPDNPTLGNFIIRQAQLISQEHEVYLIAFSGVISGTKAVDVQATSSIKGWHFQYSGTGVSKLSNYRKCRKLALRKIIEDQFEPNIIHGQITHHIGDVLFFFKKVFNVPVLCSEHWSGHLAERATKLRITDRIRLTLAKSSIDILLPVTEQLGQVLRSSGFKQQIIVWRNLVDESIFFPQDKKDFDFIHISTLDPNKRPLDIIRAFAELLKDFPNARLSLGGDGDHDGLKELMSQGMALNIPTENLEIHGKIEYDAVAQRMRRSRILIQFSNYENLPCTIGEALMSGLRIVSSDVGGIKELVNPKNGHLVEKGNIDQLLAAMKSEMKEPKQSVVFHSLSKSILLTQINEAYQIAVHN